MDHDVHCLGLPCDDGGVIPPISTCIGSYLSSLLVLKIFYESSSDFVLSGEYGASAEYGGFQFKPAELTPALCDDLYDNLISECLIVTLFYN